MSNESEWIEPVPATLLTGDEPFMGLDATVREFWAWSTSDLRENTVRGILAEFLVTKAVGAQAQFRQGWDNFDVVTPRGTRVEVKSSAYLQSWAQRKLSDIRFSGLTGLRWDPKTGHGEVREVRADVFVFAVQACKDPESYDALDVGQWEFYVASAEAIRSYGARSVGLAFLRVYGTGPLSYGDLSQVIEAACPGNRPEQDLDIPDNMPSP